MIESVFQSHAEMVVDSSEKPKIRVLHVDDELGFLNVAKQCLEIQGSFHVATACSVEEALSKLKEKEYDAIVSDYKMPGRDGLELLDELRKSGNSIPFILLTGKGREEVAARALNLGADQYLSKVGDPDTVYRELAHNIMWAVDKRRAERALQESLMELNLVLSALEEGVDIVGYDYVVQYQNKLLKDRFGALIGKTCYAGYMGFKEPCPSCPMRKAIEHKKTFRVELTGKDGRDYELVSMPLEREDGNVDALEVIKDITERRRAEKAMAESEVGYRCLVELAPDGIVAVNTEGIVTSANRSFLKLVGYHSEEEIAGKPFTELMTIRKEDIPKFQGMFMSLIRGESPSPSEFLYVRRDGTSRWAEVHPGLLTKDGKPVGVQAIVRDVTERKNVERQVQESYQKFEGLFRHNPEAAVHLDLNFIVVDVNPRFCQLFGYSAEEAKGKNVNDLVVPERMRGEAESLDEDAKNGYARHDTVRKRKDGSLVHVSISAAPVAFETNLLGYVGIYKDITDLKRAQEESEESRIHFQTLFDLMADPVAIVDDKGDVLDVTQKVEEVFGFKKEDVVGRNFAERGILTAKTKKIMAMKLAEQTIGGHVAPYEVELLTKDRRKLLVEINAARIQYKGKPATLNVIRDVSERKKLEEKLRVVGSLTRHDVRNKLSAVTGNAYLLKRKLAADPEALEHLSNMETAVREVERILEFARVYEQLGVEQLVDIDAGKAFDEAAALFSDLGGVKIVNECRGLNVLADSLLRQLFYNLIDNTLKYGEKTGQIRLHNRTLSADKLEIVYEDDGVGLPDDIRSSLFKEGFTSGKGTGYGLFMMKRICEVYGWTIRETSKQGNGAQFTIDIPKAKTGRK